MYSLSMIMKVAELYYVKKKPQKEIAKELGLSIPTVSRTLQEALNQGIVKVQIVNIQNRVFQIEEALKKAYNLEEAVVIETPSDREDWHIKKLLGRKASELFFEVVSPGSTVGIGAGMSVYEMIESFDGVKHIPGLQIIPMMGGWGLKNLQNETNKLVSSMATVLGCSFQILLSPAILSSPEVREVFLNEPQIAAVVNMWKDIDTAFFSIGPEIEYSIFPTLTESKSLMEKVQKMGAAGDILGRIIDVNGDEMAIDYNERMISIPFEQLKQIKHRIGIGGGSKKVRSINAALKSGLVNYLITDSETGTYILKNGG
ncbi:MAG TPA: sugar-binding domain-containing protein [Thermotogota bacterium]|nr:sugar-binding domain-containing protein [Thermotogota bacterium]HPJ89849.1 sugar-binding domain-containing protein [Thermotogota bacterium]HPR95922.1 sugar-binding domain-containing protein [Thermotogota bacterium]